MLNTIAYILLQIKGFIYIIHLIYVSREGICIEYPTSPRTPHNKILQPQAWAGAVVDLVLINEVCSSLALSLRERAFVLSLAVVILAAVIADVCEGQMGGSCEPALK